MQQEHASVFLRGVILVSLLTVPTGQAIKNLTIGAYFPLNGTCWKGGLATKWVTEKALSQVNKRADILPGYRLEMVANDTKCKAGVGMHILYDHIYHQPQKILLLGAAFSTVSQPLADTAKYWNLLQVSYASTSPLLNNRTLYPRFFRTISSDSAFNPARVAFIREFKWKRVATLHEDHPSGIFSQATLKLRYLLKEADVDVVVAESFSGNPSNQLSNIKSKDARIIIGGFYEAAARAVFCEAYKLGMYGGNYVWIIIGWYDDKWWHRRLKEEKITCSAHDMQQAVDRYLATDHMKLNEDTRTAGFPTISGWTAREFAEVFTNQTGFDAHYESSFAYDAVWAIALALNKSAQWLATKHGNQKSLEDFTYDDQQMADVFEQAFYNVSFLGVTGPVSFTHEGERVGLIQIEQLQGKEVQTVGVFDVQRNSLSMRSETPIMWAGSRPPMDRTVHEEEIRSVSVSLYGVMATLAALGIALALAFLVVNIVYRDRRLIKMSSPRLNNLIVVGCVMTYLSVFLFGLDGRLVSSSNYGNICVTRVWVISIGFTLAFGALFVKTWRVHAIFKSITPRKQVIKDGRLFLMVGALVFVDVFILALWTSIDPMTRELQIFEDEIRMEDDKQIIPALEHCESSNMSYWLGAIYVFKALLLLFGLFLAWETRNVTIPALNDSRYIGMSVYNVVILSSIGVAITTVTRSDQNATFAITAVFVIFSTTITLCLVFVPKVNKLWKGDGGNEASTTRKTANNQAESMTSMDNTASMTAENSGLKRTLAEKEHQLMELKRLLEADHQKRSISGRFSSSDVTSTNVTSIDVTNIDVTTVYVTKRRTSLGKSGKSSNSHVNEGYVRDEEREQRKGKSKGPRKNKR